MQIRDTVLRNLYKAVQVNYILLSSNIHFTAHRPFFRYEMQSESQYILWNKVSAVPFCQAGIVIWTNRPEPCVFRRSKNFRRCSSSPSQSIFWSTYHVFSVLACCLTQWSFSWWSRASEVAVNFSTKIHMKKGRPPNKMKRHGNQRSGILPDRWHYSVLSLM